MEESEKKFEVLPNQKVHSRGEVSIRITTTTPQAPLVEEKTLPVSSLEFELADIDEEIKRLAARRKVITDALSANDFHINNSLIKLGN